MNLYVSAVVRDGLIINSLSQVVYGRLTPATPVWLHTLICRFRGNSPKLHIVQTPALVENTFGRMVRFQALVDGAHRLPPELRTYCGCRCQDYEEREYAFDTRIVLPQDAPGMVMDAIGHSILTGYLCPQCLGGLKGATHYGA